LAFATQIRDPGFGVYVHWPFCASKCPYCDFNSHVRTGGVDQERYLAAYLRELEATAKQVPGLTVSSIFFGGGTPSLMEPATVGAILDAIAGHWTVAPDAEITLEANPSSVEAGRFAGYRIAGVNRVSLGVQSLRDKDLKALGRLHSVAEAKAAISIATSAFERVSFDLIYARPGQTVPEWRAELAEALDMQAGHLSVYQLTIEPGTAFAALHAAGKLVVPEDEPSSDLFELTQDMTAAVGLAAYEVSNHAAPGQESRHNLLYWRYGAYAGVGAGAHGRLVVDGQRLATSTARAPEAWLAQVEAEGHGRDEQTALSRSEQADEMLVMGLRISQGVDLHRFTWLTGLVPSATVLAKLAAHGLIQHDAVAGRLRTTSRGRFLTNAIILELSRGLVPAAGNEPHHQLSE
jgi:putative oxygen-independent coproporphyrinogen III oxidase